MKKTLLTVAGLTLLAGLLRFFLLGSYPVSLNWDEVSHGYNAYSLLQTGRDEWGRSLPLIFRAFGDFKLPLYIYLTTLPVWLFGLNAFAVRFVSALAGTLAVPGLYLLVRELFSQSTSHQSPRPNNHELITNHLAPISALFLAISPWHFFISRPALEANLSLTLIIFGFYFLLRFINAPRPNNHELITNHLALITSMVFLGLSLHTYNTARVFVPLLILTFGIIYRKNIFSKLHTHRFSLITSALIIGLFSALVVFQVFVGEGTARYEKLKILSPATVFQIGEMRAQSSLPGAVARAVYNRPVYFVSTFTQNYLSYFSPSFFSQRWGAQFQFAIPGQNLLTLPIFLLAFWGVITGLSWAKTDQNLRFLYAWLILSPVAASLTIDPPQALRPNPMIPALLIFACLGFFHLVQALRPSWRAAFTWLTILWTIFSFGLYLKNYFGQYQVAHSSSWQYGYRQVVDFINDHRDEYDRVIITKRYGEPHIYYAFFSKLSPQKLQPGPHNIRFNKSSWYWTDKIDSVYFVNDWQIPVTSISSLPLESGGEVPTQRSLLITSPGHVPINAHQIKTINFLDGTSAFIITSVP